MEICKGGLAAAAGWSAVWSTDGLWAVAAARAGSSTGGFADVVDKTLLDWD